MEREELSHLLRQKPFAPFRVVLIDGRIFEIRYPYMNLLAHTFIKIGIPEGDGPNPLCDHTEFVWLTQIARVEPLPNSTPAQ
jgi:hypothetical protein